MKHLSQLKLLVGIGLCLEAFGCASSSSSFPSPSSPRLNRPEAIGATTSIGVREINGTSKFSLVAAAYIEGAIYLAEHSKKKIESGTPKPAGWGYAFELISGGKVVDRFELWPGEIWLHGQRWAIEDKAVEERARLLWHLR